MNDLIDRLWEDAELIHNNRITRKRWRHHVAALLREATAPLKADIDALRKEVEEWRSCAEAQAALHDEAEDCAEELAKALAELITWIPSADTYRRLGFDPAAPMRALEKARAALGREAGND